MVELVRAGRTPAELSREFNVTAQSITNWVGQAAIDSGKEGLICVECGELVRLRRQLHQVQQEREILAKATAWFAGRSDAISTKSRTRDGKPGRLPRAHHVPCSRRIRQRLLRLARAQAFPAQHHQRGNDLTNTPDSRGLIRILRHAAREGRAHRARHFHQQTACCAPHASGPHPRHQPPPWLHDYHAPRQPCLTRQRPSQAPVQGQRPQSTLGGRHTLPAHLDGVLVLGRGHRRVEPECGGLVYGRENDDRPGVLL